MTTRRGFIAAVAAAFALDPERALWVPGRQLISIPKPRPLTIHLVRWNVDPFSLADDGYLLRLAEQMVGHMEEWAARESAHVKYDTPSIPDAISVGAVSVGKIIRVNNIPVRFLRYYDPARGAAIASADIVAHL